MIYSKNFVRKANIFELNMRRITQFNNINLICSKKVLYQNENRVCFRTVFNVPRSNPINFSGLIYANIGANYGLE